MVQTVRPSLQYLSSNSYRAYSPFAFPLLHSIHVRLAFDAIEDDHALTHACPSFRPDFATADPLIHLELGYPQ
jgi:hypothetical protein